MIYTVAGESLGVSPIRYAIFCALTCQVRVDISFTFFLQTDKFSYPALLHVSEAFLDTGEASGLEMDLVRLDLSRGKDLGKQIDIPLALRLLEAHEQNSH